MYFEINERSSIFPIVDLIMTSIVLGTNTFFLFLWLKCMRDVHRRYLKHKIQQYREKSGNAKLLCSDCYACFARILELLFFCKLRSRVKIEKETTSNIDNSEVGSDSEYFYEEPQETQSDLTKTHIRSEENKGPMYAAEKYLKDELMQQIEEEKRRDEEVIEVHRKYIESLIKHKLADNTSGTENNRSKMLTSNASSTYRFDESNPKESFAKKIKLSDTFSELEEAPKKNKEAKKIIETRKKKVKRSVSKMLRAQNTLHSEFYCEDTTPASKMRSNLNPKMSNLMLGSIMDDNKVKPYDSQLSPSKRLDSNMSPSVSITSQSDSKDLSSFHESLEHQRRSSINKSMTIMPIKEVDREDEEESNISFPEKTNTRVLYHDFPQEKVSKRRKKYSKAARRAIRELKRHKNMKQEIEEIQNDYEAYDFNQRKYRKRKATKY